MSRTMSRLALYVGKGVSWFLGQLGRGSSYPGQLALKWDDDFISHFKFPDLIVFVTGTNGKTSTTRYISNIFKEAGYKVMTNVAGANMVQGIATELINQSDLNFNIQSDVAIFEVDEGSLPNIINQVPPSHIVMLNLFPDQEDRYGSVDELAARLNDAIVADAKLILNANDPRLSWIGRNQLAKEKIYYGIEGVDFDQPYHSIKCPVCNEDLVYDFFHYEHLGYFHCSNCDFSTPDIDYKAEEVDLDQKSFMVGDYSFESPQATAYTIFNVMSAIALCRDLGIDNDTIKEGIKQTDVVRGRNEEVSLGEKKITLTLAKNPASMNQSISYLLNQQKAPYDLILSINNFKADGISIRWLTQADFSRLKESPLQKVYLTGSVRDDLYDILIEQGLDEDILFTENEESAIEKLKSSPHGGQILANYTALYDLYKHIDKQ